MTGTHGAGHARPQSTTGGPPIVHTVVHTMALNSFGKSNFRLCNDGLGGACAVNLRPREDTLAPQVVSAVHAPRDVSIDMRVLSAAHTAHVVWTRTSILSRAAVRNPLLPPDFLRILFFQQFSLNEGDSAHG